MRALATAALAVLVLAACAGRNNGIQSPSAPTGGWTLAWSDEFERPGPPDAAHWDYEEGFIRNQELQYYTRARWRTRGSRTGAS